MGRNIEVIFLDTGNTMRIVEKDDAFQYHARMKLVDLLGAQESPDALCKRLGERYDGFKKHVKETLIQPSMLLILLERATLEKEPPKGRYKPDGLISEFNALLNFFPPRE